MRRLLVASILAILASVLPAAAQDYPTRPITMIAPFPAGGPTDTLARILGDRMKTSLGQTILVENVTGAGATLGVTRAARAAPDGYTVILGNWTSHVGGSAIYPVQYDVLNDFEPISRLPVSLLDGHRQDRAAGQQREGTDRLAQGEPRQGVDGDGRHRQRGASLRRQHRARGRHQHPVRPLSRCRASGAGHGGRADRPVLRRCLECPAVRAQRPGQGFRGDEPDALVQRARDANHGGSRRAGRLDFRSGTACGLPRARPRRSSPSSPRRSSTLWQTRRCWRA